MVPLVNSKEELKVRLALMAFVGRVHDYYFARPGMSNAPAGT